MLVRLDSSNCTLEETRQGAAETSIKGLSGVAGLVTRVAKIRRFLPTIEFFGLVRRTC